MKFSIGQKVKVKSTTTPGALTDFGITESLVELNSHSLVIKQTSTYDNSIMYFCPVEFGKGIATFNNEDIDGWWFLENMLEAWGKLQGNRL